jgi:hypothetical protein
MIGRLALVSLLLLAAASPGVAKVLANPRVVESDSGRRPDPAFLIAISNSNPARPKPPKPFERATGSEAAAPAAPQTRGAIRPIPLAPRVGALLGPRLLLAWFCPDPDALFEVVLRGDDQSDVYHGRASGESLLVPEGEAALEPGRNYFWYVVAQGRGGQRTVSGPASIRVLGGQERAAVEAALAAAGPGDDAESFWRRLNVLEHEGLWYDSLAALEGRIGLEPDRADWHERRGKIYSALSWTQHAANREFQIADRLRYGWFATVLGTTRGAKHGGTSGGAPDPAGEAAGTVPQAAGTPDSSGRSRSRKPVKSDLSNFDLVDPSLPGLDSTVLAATRGFPGVVPLAPRVGRAYGQRPAFAWVDPQGSAHFEFTLQDDDGAVVLSTEVTGARFAYPPGAPALQPGRTYWWSVRTRDAAPRRSWTAGIRIVDGAERAALDAAGRPSLDALLAAGIWYDALEIVDARAGGKTDAAAAARRAALLGTLPWTEPYARRGK